MRFIDFCRSADDIAHGLEPDERIHAAARLLRVCESDQELARIARWLGDGAIGGSPTRAGIGPTVERRVYASLAGETVATAGTLDYELFEACRRMSGGTLEAIRLLLEARGRNATSEPPVSHTSTGEIEVEANALAHLPSGTARIERLVALWSTMCAVEVYWLHRLLSRSARTRVMPATEVEHAIAAATGASLEQVRHALMLCGDMGQVAVDARRRRLGDARLRPHQPLGFMRAVRSAEGIRPALENLRGSNAAWSIEPHLPGMRVQAHRWEGDGRPVAVYTTSASDVAGRLPAIASALLALPPGSILDGQLIALTEDGALAPADTLARTLRGNSGVSDLAPASDRTPVIFVALDLMAINREPMLTQTLEERRERLVALCADAGLNVVRRSHGRDPAHAQSVAARLIGAGAVGIILKRVGSLYAFARREETWLKLPAERRTTRAVVRYASFAVGEVPPRAVELTMGLWQASRDGPRLVNVCRVVPPSDVEDLAARLLEARVKRFGTTWEMRPVVVCTVRFDGVRVNGRTAAGCVLTAASVIEVQEADSTLADVGAVEPLLDALRDSHPAKLGELLHVR